MRFLLDLSKLCPGADDLECGDCMSLSWPSKLGKSPHSKRALLYLANFSEAIEVPLM
jgi:hypothetical protein